MRLLILAAVLVWGVGVAHAQEVSPEPVCTTTAVVPWLARHQAKDGSWSASGWTACGKCGLNEWPGWASDDVARTSLSLLAFLGQGNTHRFGPHKRTVNRGLRWLKRRQDARGGFAPFDDVRTNALAALFLGELVFITRDPFQRKVAKRALEYCRDVLLPKVDATHPDAVWLFLAFKTGRLAELKPKTWPFRPDWPGIEDPDPRRSAGAYLTRVFGGAYRQRSSMRKAAKRLALLTPRWPSADLEQEYFVTYALFQHGGKPWKSWHPRLQKLLLSNAETKGCRADSWPPHGGRDRVQSTALALLTLEVYYRYVRMNEAD